VYPGAGDLQGTGHAQEDRGRGGADPTGEGDSEMRIADRESRIAGRVAPHRCPPPGGGSRRGILRAAILNSLFAILVVGCGGPSRGGASGDLDAALDACARGDLAAAEALVKDARDPGSVRLRARILMMRNRNREAIELLAPLLQEKVKSYEG